MQFSKILLGALLASGLYASDKTITVGASPVPHAEILEEVVKPILEKEGYKLDVKIFNDYVIPNLAVENGELDANYFQGLP